MNQTMTLDQGLAMFCHSVENNELALPVLFTTTNGKFGIVVLAPGLPPREIIQKMASEGVRFDEVVFASEMWTTVFSADDPDSGTRTEAAMLIRVTRAGDFDTAIRPFARRANGSVSWGDTAMDQNMAGPMADALRLLVG